MKKMNFLVIAVLFSTKILTAQTVDDGKKQLYYNRFNSSKETLKAAVEKKASDADAIYWLGQVYIKQDSVAIAKALYQKALNEGVNDPFIWVGMGHVELLEGKNAEAKQRFEAAITASTKRKKENPDVLNAIGRANADGASTVGDPAYGIEKLKRAAELDEKNPAIYVNMAINFLKQGGEKSGGDAYEAYGNALRIDPKYAEANFRLGKIFQSQNNKEKFEEYFNASITADPGYAPPYIELYDYYSNRDINKAREYLEKYIANSEKDCITEFLYADYLFRSGKYQESIDKAKAMENGECNDFPRLKVLYAFNYDRLGQKDLAKQNIESYLDNSKPDKNYKDDIMFAATLFKSMTGEETTAIKYLQKALDLDTARKTRYVYMDTIASLYKKMNLPLERLNWLQKSYNTNPSPSNLDTYNIGDAALIAGNLDLADSMFSKYKVNYPDQIYGYLGLAKTAIAKDKDTTTGSAVPAVESYIDVLSKKDVQRYKGLIIQNYGYLVYVHANVKKDYEAAIKDLEGILTVDPENSYAKGTIDQIKKVIDANKGGGKAKPKA